MVSWKLRTARQSLKADDLPAAIEELESAERLQPDRAEVLYLLARGYRRSDRLEKASDYLQRAAEVGWPAEDVRVQRQLMRVQSGSFGDAEIALQELLRKGVQDDELAEEIYEARARGYLRTYRLADAALCLKFWIAWQQEAVKPRMWLADVWDRVDRRRDAVAQYRAVLKIDPKHNEARRRLGEDLLELHQVRDAKRQFEACLALDPGDVAANIGLAKCETRLAETDAARRLLQSLLKKEISRSQKTEVLIELGKMELRESNRPAAALELLRQAEQLDPNNHLVHINLAAAYRRLGKDAPAEAHETKGRQIERRFGRLTEITRELVKSPRNVALRLEAGKILMQQGMKREGAAWIGTVLMIDPHHRAARLALADYCEETGRPEAAREHRRLAAPPGE